MEARLGILITRGCQRSSSVSRIYQLENRILAPQPAAKAIPLEACCKCYILLSRRSLEKPRRAFVETNPEHQKVFCTFHNVG